MTKEMHIQTKYGLLLGYIMEMKRICGGEIGNNPLDRHRKIRKILLDAMLVHLLEQDYPFYDTSYSTKIKEEQR